MSERSGINKVAQTCLLLNRRHCVSSPPSPKANKKKFSPFTANSPSTDVPHYRKVQDLSGSIRYEMIAPTLIEAGQIQNDIVKILSNDDFRVKVKLRRMDLEEDEDRQGKNDDTQSIGKAVPLQSVGSF